MPYSQSSYVIDLGSFGRSSAVPRLFAGSDSAGTAVERLFDKGSASDAVAIPTLRERPTLIELRSDTDDAQIGRLTARLVRHRDNTSTEIGFRHLGVEGVHRALDAVEGQAPVGGHGVELGL